MSADTAKSVCEYVVKQIVDKPDEVSVAQSVTVGDGDMGRVIGKRGRVASAIRTVVRSAGIDDDVAAIEVEFVD